MQANTPKQHTNARWIMRRSDLPDTRIPQDYKITKADLSTRGAVLSKRKRQVIEALRIGPIYCASPVRLSDVVHILKREHQINIATDTFTDHADGETATFGVYRLVDTVTPVGTADREAA